MPPMLGQISFFPYDFAPRGWMFCDGSQLFIGDNEYLFSMFGFKFGGDHENMFAVPDLRQSAPANCHYCISTAGLFKPALYEGIVGETMLAFDDPSARNLLNCTGQSFNKDQYPFLAMYMKNRFGGDGVNTFSLPDLRSKAPGGFRYQICVQGDDPQFPNAREPYVGELFLLPYEVDTSKLLLCNGSKLPRQGNEALFSLIGNHFGQDSTTFSLPDLRSAAPAKYNYCISHAGVFPSRS